MKRRQVRNQMNKAPPRESRFTIGLERDPRGQQPHAGAGEAFFLSPFVVLYTPP